MLQMDFSLNSANRQQKCKKLEEQLKQMEDKLKEKKELLKQKEMIMITQAAINRTLNEACLHEVQSSIKYLLWSMVDLICTNDDDHAAKYVDTFDENQTKKRVKNE